MHNQDTIFSTKHPVAMYLLALTEMCQRFTYWSSANLLVLFFVKHFTYSIPKATHLFGIYMGIASLLPLLGGYLVDKWNYRHPIFFGIILTAIGCFLLIPLQKLLLIPALICIGLGGGIFIPTIYPLLGSLYTQKPHIREGGFSIYYALINIGPFVGLLLLGYLQRISWAYTFLVAGLVPLLGLIPYRYALKIGKFHKIPHRHFTSKKDDPHNFSFKRQGMNRILIILLMTFVSTIFWIAYNQAGSSMTLFAFKYTNRNIGSFSIPSPWFKSSQSFFLLLFTFPLTQLYLFLRRIQSNASPLMKTALSLFFIGLTFLVMQRAAASIPFGATQGSASPYYLLFAFALMALAELFLAPIGISLITYLSPHRYKGLLTGCWFSCMGIGLYLGGYLAGFMTKISLSSFFDMFVFLSFIPAFLLVLFSKKLDTMRHIRFF